MKRLALLLVVVGVSSLAAADDAKTKAIKEDREKIAGTWQATLVVADGNKVPDEDARKITVLNEKDGKWVLRVDGKVIARGTSTIDPTTTPKVIDGTVTEGDSKGTILSGIYEISKDKRKVCFARDRQQRPDKFESTAGSGNLYVEFERVKGGE